jgi:hypothetical protein
VQHSQGSETKEKLGEDGFPNAEELGRRSRPDGVFVKDVP